MVKKSKDPEEVLIREYLIGNPAKSHLIKENDFRLWCQREFKMKKALRLPLLDLVIAMNDTHAKDYFRPAGHWSIASGMRRDDKIVKMV